MAEAVIISIAGEIVANLVPQAIERVGKLWGVKHELEALKKDVSTLQDELDHAEEQYNQSPRIKGWVGELKEAFYDAQDVLEEFNIEAMRRELRGHNEMVKEVRTFFSSSNQLAFKLKMSYKVRAVRERIKAIEASRRFSLDKRPADSRVEREWGKTEETHSFIHEGDIIGRDDDKKAVMKFLLDSDVQENVSILPIVGIGGLGKTALAQCVYNHEMVSKQFDLKMWVCVSNDFNVTKIIKSMIACAQKKEPTEVAIELLQSKLRGEIDGKRYLLVLDDVWNTDREIWRSLKQLLEGGARGSKILITTRLFSVAEITGATQSHLLKGLSESVSLELLMQMACCKEEEIQDPDMLAIGEDIVRKCSGVPLVVRTIGSLLFKKSKFEWSQFKENELPDVSQREDGIISILKLSYDHLPSHLKQCFAFCSLFPKDYEIKKQTLVDIWMAEGFIQRSNRSQHLEDIAHGYFKDLLWGNFFQDYRENDETCKMHDLMHDLACLVAGTECCATWDHTKLLLERTRHLSHDLNSNFMGKLPISHLKASALRTFLSATRYWRKEPTSEADLCQLIQSFKRLRILDLHERGVKKVPRSICKLKYLTYLDLSGNHELKRLPNSITRLQNLQTLKLNCCFALEELPRGIRKLVNLRNLDIDGCNKLSYVPCGLGQLTSLHRLTRFILPQNKALAKNYCSLGELNGLNDIRGSFSIENLGSMTDAVVESRAANLMGKHSLESLALKWGKFDTDDAVIGDTDEALLGGLRPYSNLQKLTIEGYKGESFPGWMMDSLVSSLPNLVEVSFSDCRRCKHLPPLGELPRLKTLNISGLTELEYIESDHSSTLTESFPSLLRLSVINCEKLKAMPLTPQLEVLDLIKANVALINLMIGLNKLKRMSIHRIGILECLPEQCLKSLTSLEYLEINGCHRLTSLSVGMRHLSNLKELHFWNCKELDISKDESGNILDFQGLHSLRSVKIGFLPQLASLPPWLLQASNLERLSIGSCENLKELPEQIAALQSLQELCIRECPSLTSLPEGMRRLESLTHLRIYDCEELDSSKDESGPSILVFHGLQSLRSVFLYKLPKLASLPQWLLQASNLEHLGITACENLKALPEQIQAVQSLQSLKISGCHELDLSKDEKGNILNFQGLQSLRSVQIHRLPKLASLPRWLLQLSNLEHLTISGCDNLKELPEQIVALQSLQELKINGCDSLTSLPEGMRRLASLAHLKILWCDELDISKDEKGNILNFQGLQSLRSVEIICLPKLASLPQWLLQLSNLERLEISSCDNLKELPEQIAALQSLQELQITSCSSLTSLPEGMRRLKSLTRLHISDCPELEKRCKSNAGKDWYKIAHIPNITIYHLFSF